MILRRSVACLNRESRSLSMNTGFFPEPNYILATTGGVGYAMLSYWLGVLEVWYVTVLWTLVLSLTSIWFHVGRTDVAHRIDNFTAISFVFFCLYESWIRGIVAFGIGLLIVLYSFMMFYIGAVGKCFAFHEDRLTATLYHASIHVASMVGMILIATLFPVIQQ